jgi:chemotaxis protein CheD
VSEGTPTRFWDQSAGRWIVQVLPGQLYVTAADEIVTTVLGSCVSACIRDPERGVGGINHFMLPQQPRFGDSGSSARYGLYALECLINDILKRGGDRDGLEVKVFGGGRVINAGGDIGRSNIDFVRSFFADEGIPIVSEDVGGEVARRLRYYPRSGKVLVKQMPMRAAAKIIRAEVRLAETLPPPVSIVELF